MRPSATHSSLRKFTCLLVAAALILTPLCYFRSRSVKAFRPNDLLAVGFGGPKSWSHASITEGAITGLYQEFFGTTNVDRRGRAAIARINGANAESILVTSSISRRRISPVRISMALSSVSPVSKVR